VTIRTSVATTGMTIRPTTEVMTRPRTGAMISTSAAMTRTMICEVRMTWTTIGTTSGTI
jgi:hypothetical protein